MLLMVLPLKMFHKSLNFPDLDKFRSLTTGLFTHLKNPTNFALQKM